MSRILVVEDEQHLADGLRFNLEAEGHVVTVEADGERALALLLPAAAPFDVAVLDVMLPGRDGFSIAAEVRKAGRFIPILMLTARSRPEDVLRGFESGADDYLPKPFELQILIARIHGLLRRSAWAAANGKTRASSRPAPPPPFRFAGKTLDFATRELKAGKQVLSLTTMEADLLAYLIRNAGKPVSRKAILEDVWGLHEDTDTRAIDNFIARLRKYIEKNPAAPRHLLTVRGVGYKFIAEPE